MTSKNEIVNRAIIYLGEVNTANIELDGNTVERKLNVLFDGTARALLREHPWNCAITRASIPSSGAPAFGWKYQYPLPTSPRKCLRLVGVTKTGKLEDGLRSPEQYVLEGNKILTDVAGPLNIVFVAEIKDFTQYDDMLADTLSAKLAVDACFSITNSMQYIPDLQSLYQKKLDDAKFADASESPTQGYSGDVFIGAR